MIGNLDKSLHDGLQPVPSALPVFVSPGLGAAVADTIERVERAHSFYIELLGVEPRLAVLLLEPAEWADRSAHPLYGMPNYREGNLVLAGRPNTFWDGLVDLAAGEIPDARRLLGGIYPSERGTVDLSPFFELLGVHELAHIFLEADNRVPAKLWALEVACNVLLHAYVASEQPEHLPVLETFPAVFARITPDRFTHRTLADFEQSYAHGMDGANYGWFQARFHVTAKHLYDAVGAEGILTMWDLLDSTEDAEFEHLVADRLGPSAADALRRLNEP